jgi:hypothetical protein
LGAVRRRTMICCRNVKISASSAARDRNRSTTAHTMSLTRHLITDQHRPILGQPPVNRFATGTGNPNLSGTVCRTALACLTVGHMSVFPAARNGRPPAYSPQPPAGGRSACPCHFLACRRGSLCAIGAHDQADRGPLAALCAHILTLLANATSPASSRQGAWATFFTDEFQVRTGGVFADAATLACSLSATKTNTFISSRFGFPDIGAGYLRGAALGHCRGLDGPLPRSFRTA